MMCNADILRFDIAAQVLKITITQVARSHLDAHTMHVGISLRVEVDEMQRHVEATAKLLAELLIAHRFGATQMEVAVSSLNAYAQFVLQMFQHEEQRHAVCAARKRHNILAPINEQFVDRGEASHSVHERIDYRRRFFHSLVLILHKAPIP